MVFCDDYPIKIKSKKVIIQRSIITKSFFNQIIHQFIHRKLLLTPQTISSARIPTRIQLSTTLSTCRALQQPQRRNSRDDCHSRTGTPDLLQGSLRDLLQPRTSAIQTNQLWHWRELPKLGTIPHPEIDQTVELRDEPQIGTIGATEVFKTGEIRDFCDVGAT